MLNILRIINYSSILFVYTYTGQESGTRIDVTGPLLVLIFVVGIFVICGIAVACHLKISKTGDSNRSISMNLLVPSYSKTGTFYFVKFSTTTKTIRALMTITITPVSQANLRRAVSHVTS